jgi:hypothetical protein
MTVTLLYPSVPPAEGVYPLHNAPVVHRHNHTKERMALVSELRSQKWARSAFVALTGSLACAVILEQILYWHSPDKNGVSRLRVMWADDYWLVKSRDEMLMETGTSLKQYKTAIATLRELGVIDYRIGGFSGKPTPFIRLDTLTLRNLLVLKGAKPLVPFEPNDWSLLAQANTVTLATVLTKEVMVKDPIGPSQGIPEQETLTAELDYPTAEETLNNSIPSGKIPMSKKLPSSSTAILAVLKAKQGTAPLVPPNTLKSAKAIWKKWVSQFHPSVGMLPELTLKSQGQLSYIVKQFGITADTNLKHVISHWVAYTKFVAGQKGIKLTPDVPDIGFLQKYVGEAGSFVIQSVQLIAQAPTTKPKVIISKNATPEKVGVLVESPKPVAVPVPAAAGGEDDVASLDDVLAWKSGGAVPSGKN